MEKVPKILIVDDDLSVQKALKLALNEEGYELFIANNGKEGLEIFYRETPELIFLDLKMPVMDGYETTRQIRTRREFAGLPILALTAKAMKGDREKCLEAGANDYLPKPVDVDRLFSMLRVWLYQ